MRQAGTILFYLLLMVPSIVFCQNDTIRKSDIYIGLEAGTNSIKEENIIAKVNTGMISGLNFKYVSSGKRFHEIYTSFGYSKVKTSLENEKVSRNLQFLVDYSLLLRIKGKSGGVFLPGFNSGYFYTLMESPVWDESHAHWGSTLFVGPSCRFRFRFKKEVSWITSWNGSLINIYSRPDKYRYYAQENWSFFKIIGTTNSGFRVGQVNNMFLSDLRSEICLPARSGVSFSVTYSMLYIRMDIGGNSPLNMVTNKFGIAIGF